MRTLTLYYALCVLPLNAIAQTDFTELERRFDHLLAIRDHDNALLVAAQVTDASLEELGDTSEWYAWGLLHEGAMNDIVGDLRKQAGNYKQAEEHYLAGLSIYRVIMEPSDPYFTEYCDRIGALYWETGRSTDALSYFNEALRIRRATVGEEDPSIASSLSNIGLAQISIADFQNAEKNLLRSAEIRKKTLGPNTTDHALSLNNLGGLYNKMGDVVRAEEYYRQAMDIRREVYGEDHRAFAESLNNLGVVSETKGDYKSAEQYLLRAAAIRRKVHGAAHPEYAFALNNLGMLYRTMGDLDAAEQNSRLASEIIGKAHGENSPHYATIQDNLGTILMAKGDFVSAIQPFQRALDIRMAGIAEDPLAVMVTLNNMGILYREAGLDSLAVKVYDLALIIGQRYVGEEHPMYGTVLNNLAAAHFSKGDDSMAESYSRRALAIMQKSSGSDHPEVANRLTDLAMVCERTNRAREALDLYEESYTSVAKRVRDEFEWLSTEQQSHYLIMMRQYFEPLFAFSAHVSEQLPEAAALAYDAALLTKSRLLEARLQRRGVGSPMIEHLQSQLARCRSEIAKKESDGTSSAEALVLLRAQADSLDKDLALAWPDYAVQRRNMSVTWPLVQAQLAADEAAIEFVRYLDTKGNIFKYMALLVRKDLPQPILVPLCHESALKEIRPWSGSVAYYPLVWEPLERYLMGIGTVYYSPTATLNQVPFHALSVAIGAETMPDQPSNSPPTGSTSIPWPNKIDQDASCLMDRYIMHQLTSTRDLALELKQRSSRTLEPSITLIGDIDYDRLPTGEKRQNPGQWKYLEGSAREVKDIAAQLENKEWKVSRLEGESATEDALLALSGVHAPEVLHISTHGFAFAEREDSLPTGSRGLTGMRDVRTHADPMLRCGLLLSGANWSWAGSDTLLSLGATENGILAAAEVANMDLRATKLVVLSACETGLGETQASEGTFGMARGFKLAGADQLIVSLWPVPDDRTAELMAGFYTELAGSRDAVAAFGRTQRTMRMKYPDRPEDWAGFVLIR